MTPIAEDRNLLFAVIALQADFLTPEQFVEGCTLWATQKATPLADLLVRRGWLTDDDKADVERLLERKLKKHGGQPEAALAEITSDHLRQSLVGVDQPILKSLIAGTPSPGENVLVSTTFHPQEDRERYTITRLHATGGIGRVWLARDGALGRDVALKEIRPERSGMTSVWARFLKEAKITGQLEHPGIVPVYELGTSSKDDRPFYTMRFVKGRTFRDAINVFHQKRRRNELGSLELRELLTAFVGICNAVAYAHSRGVVHRDLKPANVVLGDYGEVMVLDWGLAKVVGEPDDPAAQEPMVEDHDAPDDKTMQGQILGTPAYMAPEQADGRLDLIDARTDVYGLGSILFELLTDQPPFNGTTTQEVLDRVRHLAPDRPRDLVREMPRAVEAICLKCLAKRATDRYATAKAVAAEVLHFLADEPVAAYAEPWTLRARRWAKRHRTLVTSAFATAVIAFPILVTGLVLLDRAGQRERQAKETAQANYERALKSADLMAGQMARGVRPLAGTQRKTVIELLEGATQIYAEFLADSNPPAEVLRNQAATWVVFAELYRETNRTPTGLHAAERAIGLYDKLLAGTQATRDDRVGRAKALHRRAWILFDQGYDDRARASFEECIHEMEAAGVEDDPVVAAQFLGSAHTMLANLLVGLGDVDRARTHYERGLTIREKAFAAKPGDVDIRIGLGLSLEKLGRFKSENGEAEAGLELIRRAGRELAELAGSDPGNSEIHLHYIRALNTLAQTTILDPEIEQSLKTAFQIADRFARRDPGHMIWERESMRQRYNQERTDSLKGLITPERRVEAAQKQLAFLTEFLAAVQKRDREDPENYLWRADSANVAGRVGKAHYDLAKLGQNVVENLKRAEEFAKQSIAEYETVLARSPRNVDAALGRFYADWLYSEVAFERKDDLEGIRRAYDFLARQSRFYLDLLSRYPESEFARRECRRALSIRSSRLSTIPILKVLLGAKDDEGVVAAYLPFLRVVADVPPGASDAVKEIYVVGQKRAAPFGRVLLEAGKLTETDRRRVESLPGKE